MKKILTLFAAAVIAVSASAQTQMKHGLVAPSKAWDNIYVGVNGGVATKTLNNAWLKNLNPNLGLRVGRWFTPAIGIQLEGNLYLDQKAREDHKDGAMFIGDYKGANRHDDVFAKYGSVNANVTFNLSNIIAGYYPGEPRRFEVLGLVGIGAGHVFGHSANGDRDNKIISKVGLDFGYNLGKKKAWMIYLEPALIYDIADDDRCYDQDVAHNYNLARSAFQLNAGVMYKFKNSNGTHNFTLMEVRDQAEIDGLNGKINDLRNELSGKDGEIARLRKQLDDCNNALKDCQNKPAPVVEVKKDPLQTNLMPKVIFKLNKTNVEASQVANIEMIAKYMKNNPEAQVLVKGYASMEGQLDHNIWLAENRAAAAKDMLVKKYGIDPARLTAEGCGPTSELSDVLDFNRVATFEDITKK
ncbi:MAG: OmpA family protein [Bacteroidaceae bacterium]|nr:OmpA family protein [Bacteroidaceae bacterium]